MKRTRKWAFVKQEAIRLADLGLEPKEIATRLGPGVNRSTVQRWMAAGKIRDTRRGSKQRGLPAFSREIKPEAWGKTVRKDYALDATDEQLVALAEMMLAISKDPLEPKSVRMRASSEFRACAKQLNLAVRGADAQPVPAPAAKPDSAAASKSARPAKKRPAVDPRKVLMMPTGTAKS